MDALQQAEATGEQPSRDAAYRIFTDTLNAADLDPFVRSAIWRAGIEYANAAAQEAIDAALDVVRQSFAPASGRVG